MNTYHVYTEHMSPALNGSSVLECFERSNAIEMRNGIMFDFYPGLPHIIKLRACCSTSLHVTNMYTHAYTCRSSKQVTVASRPAFFG